jgi:hypothetical protein
MAANIQGLNKFDFTYYFFETVEGRVAKKF